jgi:hypothetical protein
VRNAYLLSAAVALLLCVLAGCSAEGGLRSRACTYYEFMVGRTARGSYSSYLSPAYRSKFDSAALEQLDGTKRLAKVASDLYPECRSEDVFITMEGRFAQTRANPGLGSGYENLGSTKWVKAGRRWFLYLGSDAEIEAYGTFPVSVSAPVLPPASQEPEGEVVLPKGG